MKEELETKDVPPSFSARLMDNWHQCTQNNKSAKSMSRNSMNFSSDAMPSIRKMKLKFFLDSKLILEKNYELNC